MFLSFHLTDSSLDQSEVVAELLKELSNHNERIEERKAALCELLKLIRENTLQVWDEHFKTILLLLLETMGDREVNTLFLEITLVKICLNSTLLTLNTCDSPSMSFERWLYEC